MKDAQYTKTNEKKNSFPIFIFRVIAKIHNNKILITHLLVVVPEVQAALAARGSLVGCGDTEDNIIAAVVEV